MEYGNRERSDSRTVLVEADRRVKVDDHRMTDPENLLVQGPARRAVSLAQIRGCYCSPYYGQTLVQPRMPE